MPVITPQEPPNPGKTKKLRVLVACEYSGRVREAFKARGHYAMSCDLLNTEMPGEHYHGDMRDVIGWGWDLMVAFPPCTYLAGSGNRWHTGSSERVKALEFIRWIMSVDIEHVAIENPVGAISTAIRKPDQVIQPWMFGHGETKATCLWLKSLPKLTPTNIVEGREQRVWKEPNEIGRWRKRSRTFEGIALAMAEQWG